MLQKMKYISYIRISTTKQDISGLGAEAQRKAISNFIKQDDILVAEYKEAESGKNDLRPELQKAIEHCKEIGATLLIQKLDRLSRNVAFIFMLRDTQVPFTCIEFPEANNLTIGILAVLAQEERERISQRTKVALEVLKSKGILLGKPENLTDYSRLRSKEMRKKQAESNLNNRRATALVASMRKEDKSYHSIANELNKYGFKTRRNKEFTAMTVKRLYDRYTNNNED
ncbi:recombinase family protein [Myroides odoratimimus]|uniref:recombinase family protein n=1 Tax=Myroides odoratimimus TaxID=76832 RepID=UPI0038D49643